VARTKIKDQKSLIVDRKSKRYGIRFPAESLAEDSDGAQNQNLPFEVTGNRNSSRKTANIKGKSELV
jgi:hypothetical protein